TGFGWRTPFIPIVVFLPALAPPPARTGRPWRFTNVRSRGLNGFSGARNNEFRTTGRALGCLARIFFLGLQLFATSTGEPHHKRSLQSSGQRLDSFAISFSLISQWPSTITLVW